MKIIICSFIVQSFCYLSFSQNDTTRFYPDSLRKMIERLAEYKEEQKHFDSISKNSAFSNFSVGVREVYGSKIVYASIDEQLDSVNKVAYLIKYDMKLKKIISIEKQK
jgi:hypothetical protein